MTLDDLTDVTYAVTDGVAVVTINRPDRMNAFRGRTVDELIFVFKTAWASRDIGAVVLTGAGEKAFCAGGDVKERAETGGYGETEWGTFEIERLHRIIRDIPKPVIAAVTGYALGGGYELALCADFRVLGTSAKIGQPEIQLGVIPGAGGTQRLARLVGPAKAKDLVFTGRHVGAEEALEFGLADAVVPDAEVYDTAVAMARKFAAGPPLALAAAKKAIDEGLDRPLREGLTLESRLFAELFDTEDQKTGMRSFLENGPGKARFTGR